MFQVFREDSVMSVPFMTRWLAKVVEAEVADTRSPAYIREGFAHIDHRAAASAEEHMGTLRAPSHLLQRIHEGGTHLQQPDLTVL